MSTIRTILSNSSTIFGRMKPAELKRQQQALKYIELVAMQANISIDEWDILETFKVKKGSNKIITAPKEINKRLFTKNQINKELYQRAALMEVMSKEKMIKGNLKRYVKPLLANYDYQLQNAKDNLKHYQTANDLMRIQNVERQIKQIEEKIATGVGEDRTYKDIGRVVMNGFWKFIGSSGTKLKFITNSNIILFDKNTRTKMNLQKDFGVFLCQVDVRNMNATIHAFKGNSIYSRDYLHPYVCCNGICFGNAQEAVEQARNARDLYKLMNIVGMVIGTYNGGGTPHVSLATFIQNNCVHVDMTAEAKKYYDNLKPIVDPLKEFMQEVGGLRKVGNMLASSIGSRPVDAADQTHDDEDEDYEDDEEYEEEQEDEEDYIDEEAEQP